MNEKITIELSRDEFEVLLLALGMAAGSISRIGNPSLFNKLLRLANAVNRNNPAWTPYEVPER